MKNLSFDHTRTLQRIDDTQKLLDSKNYDLKNK